MNCRDFSREADALLDADADASPSAIAIEARLIAHAENCPACRPILNRYQTLRRAIGAWKNPPAPSARLIDRVIEATRDLEPEPSLLPAAIGSSLPRARLRLIAGLAASLFLLAVTGALVTRRMPPESSPPTNPSALKMAGATTPSQGLNRALAEATLATIALARSASVPAARVGRELLVVVETPENASIVPTSLDPIGAGSVEAVEVLQRVGDEVAAGVRPLSNSARHAFGFLLDTPRPAGSRPSGSNTHGARNG